LVFTKLLLLLSKGTKQTVIVTLVKNKYRSKEQVFQLLNSLKSLN
jgi:hypothetical protein